MKIRRFCSLFFALILTLSLAQPALASNAEDGPFEVEAAAALLIDPDTEEILYEYNIHERLYPASLTKVMTCLLVLEAIDSGILRMTDVVTASELAITSIPPDGSTAGLKVGEELTIEQLLYCIMLSSANEGCNILAEALSGSIEAFVEQMNAKAQALNCEDTHFNNTNGLPDENHYTTAWDLYLITRAARTHPDFMPIVSTIYYEVPETNLSSPRKLYTTNYLISSYRTSYYLYQGAAGIKTGFTSAAGYCLISSAARNGRSLLSVVLGAKRITEEDGTIITKSFTETKRLFDHGFNDFSRVVLLKADELVGEVPVTLSQEQNTVKVHPSQEIERLLPKSMNPALEVDRVITYNEESVEAPVTKDQVLGTITVKRGNIIYGTANLLADEDVSASRLLVFRRDLINFLKKPALWFAIGGVAAVIFLIAVIRAVLRARRISYRRTRKVSTSSGYRGRKK
ncbi:MAG: D-alanyl-D-alanine carboxypeptidase [Oscillospiraceae bacterium]|nr:D-alanyl-D-alanine carboxypeptidase [Oscillospiraceae bacterium]